VAGPDPNDELIIHAPRETGEPIRDLDRLAASLYFAQISQVAYAAVAVVEPLIGRLGLHMEQYIDRDGAQAYVFGNDIDVIVACRGTEPDEWNDVRADVNALTVVAETVGRVHRGFKQEVDDLWPRIERLVASEKRDLWFTGHSLGGAMATISAGRCFLAHIPANPVHIYTYGAPRVGTKRYVNNADVPLTRWVNNNDLVPRVPPMWLGYRHTGKPMYIDSGGRVRRLTAKQRSQDRWVGFRDGLRQGKVDHFSDHAISEYVRHLLAAVGGG
jgi:triacylglycerol lipase